MERKIGEEFEYDDIRLRVVEAASACDNCYFLDSHGICFDSQDEAGVCDHNDRCDGKIVVFKRVVDSAQMEENIARCKECVQEKASPNKEKSKDLIETLLDMDVRSFNVGNSDYSKHKIQTWDIWTEYQMNPFDADIAKRLNRKKAEPGVSMIESRIMDYTKIIHVCLERIRQLKQGYDPFDPTIK